MFNKQLPKMVTRQLLLGLLCLPSVAAADLLLISRVSDGDAPATAAYLWVGSSALRFDNGKQALIADLAQQRIHLLDHNSRTVTSGPLTKTKGAAPVVQVSPGTTTIRRWSATEHVLNWPEYKLSSRVFTSQIDGIDSAVFTKTVRQLAGVPGAHWLAAVAELPGIPVRIETTRINADGSVDTQVRDTVNVLRRTPPVAAYRVPSSYKAQ